MFSQRRCYLLVLDAFCFNLLLCSVSALNVEYCSSLNTATTAKNSSIYQSNGLCHDFCLSNYAFAVLQGDGCWCSDYVPGTTTTGCDSTCPGYPDDLCGGNGLYGYIALTIEPSGTEGASSAAASSTSASAATQVTVTATPQAVTVVETPTTSPSPSPAESSTSFSSSVSSTESSTTPITTSSKALTSSSSSSSSTWTATPVTSLETVTGQVRTVTVTPTAPPTSGSSTGITQNKSSGGLSTGGIVGLVFGILALVASIAGIIFCCIHTRRRNKAEEYNNMSRRGSSAGLGSAGETVPSRTMSQNSRFVLNTDGRQVVETWEPGDMPGIRTSRLMPVDPRLDPFAAVYQRGENKSRESINTIRDDQDYSRRVAGPAPILRATNPDDLDD
ncbi:uncharacterized protein LY89DRAFT_589814 [Mollisia scopiformis]|uniref:WSC domain-containing protein n=1 Tax=Mollisia scopiformis TaxID=149040 RepID=A0A194X2K8_MOLSC|nr:uncharacterized protein LY89DRAFT_589814 [Mollisia scopiformis]KUJ14249.1 hypothetical protein LY89DRAFT_589814 [Mollisia scopiformis]